jgi:hypothetical protein
LKDVGQLHVPVKSSDLVRVYEKIGMNTYDAGGAILITPSCAWTPIVRTHVPCTSSGLAKLLLVAT